MKDGRPGVADDNVFVYGCKSVRLLHWISVPLFCFVDIIIMMGNMVDMETSISLAKIVPFKISVFFRVCFSQTFVYSVIILICILILCLEIQSELFLINRF